jgi:hypothetical protein
MFIRSQRYWQLRSAGEIAPWRSWLTSIHDGAAARLAHIGSARMVQERGEYDEKLPGDGFRTRQPDQPSGPSAVQDVPGPACYQSAQRRRLRPVS